MSDAETPDAPAVDTPQAPEAPATPPPAAPDADTFDRAYVEKLRQENAKARTRAKELEEAQQATTATLAAMKKALGLDAGDPTPEDLAAKLAEKDTEIRRLRVRQAFEAAAAEAGAVPKLTWALMTAEGQVDDLDPSSDTFAETLLERVKAAVTAEPALARSQPPATPPPPRKSGGDLNGANGDGITQLTREDLMAMSGDPDAIEAARQKGQLRSLMGA